MSKRPAEEKKECRLCDNKPFKSSEDFDFHLTMIHYRDKLLDLLGDPPYSCKRCGFHPTADDPNEEMILHLGCKERFAIKYYVEECQNLTPSAEKKTKREISATFAKIELFLLWRCLEFFYDNFLISLCCSYLLIFKVKITELLSSKFNILKNFLANVDDF